MNTVVSQDGTSIAFERSGHGPPLVFVDGALCHRAFGPSKPMAAELMRHFTVITYDRRGRGESGDAGAWAPQREVEDIAALLREAGGSAYLVGVSSGAALALEAACAGLPVRALALYEAPFIVDDSRPPIPEGFLARLNESVASDRRSDAVRMFMKLVGAPAIAIAIMRLTPVWKKLKAAAHTLPYDISLVQDYQRGRPLPRGRWSGLRCPTLVIGGGKSPLWMQNGVRDLAGVLPGAQLRMLDGQTHMVKPRAIAPILLEFFAANDRPLSPAPPEQGRAQETSP